MKEQPVPGCGAGWRRPPWAVVVVRLLRRAVPAASNNPEVLPAWQQLLPHMLAAVDADRPIDNVPEELSWLLTFAAGLLLARFDARAALPLFQRPRRTACLARR